MVQRPHSSQRTQRGVALQVVLEERPDRELRELLSFWDGHEGAGHATGRLVGELRKSMSSEKAVRKRVKFLSKKLVDLLKFFLRGEGYRADLEHVTGTKSFSYLSPFELKAAINALIKRGFLFTAQANGGDKTDADRSGGSTDDDREIGTFLVPCELGDVLQAFIWDDDRSVEEIFSLRGQLGRLIDRRDLRALLEAQLGEAPATVDHAQAAAALAGEAVVAARLAELPEAARDLLRVVAIQYGGIASRAALEKSHKALSRYKRKDLQELLEGQLLGTVRHVSLGEYGIHQFDEAVVLFGEVVPAVRQILGRKEPDIELVRSLGVDLISDVSAFLSFVEHNAIKLTLSGKVYRTAVRKLEDGFILAGTSGFPGDWLFQYLFDFCMSQSMISRGDDRSVVLTIKGRSWDRTPLDRKLSRLLRFSTGNWTSQVEPFHGERLLGQYLDRIRELPVGRWAEVNAPAFDARNAYLADLDNLSVRDRFQSRYQFAQQSGMPDPQQLALSLTTWARERLFLFGLIDLAEHDGKQVAMRLTPLGAKALGVEMPEGAEVGGKPLIVNPDFEIILFPNDDTYDLITVLDRFADRISSDSAYRYKITEGSIEKAVAEGTEPSSILRTLSEHSRVEVPQNVIYSIGQWAGKVKFVNQAMVSLVRGRNKEVVDRILHDDALRGFVIERLSPTSVLMSLELDRDELARLLQPLGVFLEEGDG